MVYYRKYRPQTIDELDSQDVRSSLSAVLSAPSVPHAFLFTGPKGLGKTSTARIIAKVLNCEGKGERGKGKDIEPCNKCDQCSSITNGTNLDVLEIDAASNRGIDEIRDLREKVRIAPVSAKNKVYIIDEVHMLTTEAFNALLKTLEEPPAHVIFILCTTEPHKIPATILSRCFHISFRFATTEELTRSFRRIADAEKLIVSDETLEHIARLAYGGFRDGVKILEEIAIKTDNKEITTELVEKMYHVTNLPYIVSEMLALLANKEESPETQIGRLLTLISDMTKQGIDVKAAIEMLISELHRMLLIRFGIGEFSDLDKQHAADFSVEDIQRLVALLTNAHSELKTAVIPQLPLELAMISWFEGSLPNVNHSTRGPVSKAQSSALNGSEQNFWDRFVAAVKQQNNSLAGVLRGASMKEYDGENLAIETAYTFHLDRLEEPKARAVLQLVADSLSGKTIKLTVQLKGGVKQ